VSRFWERGPDRHQPAGRRDTWTPEQWAQIEYLARVAAGVVRTGCVPRTAMRSLRAYGNAALAAGGKS
jgi:hypothetical protein